jgi:hypothetical protein
MSTEPTEPAPTEPAPTEPAPTEPAPESTGPTGTTGPTEPAQESTGPTGPTEPAPESTGPTGTTGPTEPAPESTGPTGPSEPTPETSESTGPTGPTEPVVEQEPPSIATMEELMASHAVIVAQEAAERATLAPLLHPTREGYRPQMFAWAAAGFPAIYVVQSFTFTPPSVCSDGVTRDVVAYAWYLLGTDISQVITKIQSLLTGIVVSYSFAGNVLRIHVSRA